MWLTVYAWIVYTILTSALGVYCHRRHTNGMQDLHDIKLQVVGINNLSTWDLSDSPGFCDSYVKFSSSRAKKRQIINKLGTIQGSGTEQVKPEGKHCRDR